MTSTSYKINYIFSVFSIPYLLLSCNFFMCRQICKENDQVNVNSTLERMSDDDICEGIKEKKKVLWEESDVRCLPFVNLSLSHSSLSSTNNKNDTFGGQDNSAIEKILWCNEECQFFIISLHNFMGNTDNPNV